jgi:hypothetical protein
MSIQNPHQTRTDEFPCDEECGATKERAGKGFHNFTTERKLIERTINDTLDTILKQFDIEIY